MRRSGKKHGFAKQAADARAAAQAAGARPVFAVAALLVATVALCALALALVRPSAALAEDDVPPAVSTSPSASPSPSPGDGQGVNKPETPQGAGKNAGNNVTTPVIELEDNVVNASQLPDSSFLYDTSITALTSADSYYDGQMVQVVGEAIGDSVSADLQSSHCWVTLATTEPGLSDSIAVYLSQDSAKLIDSFGRYGVTGTVLQVRGVFHLACIEHDGITDLHAETASIVESSQKHPDVLNPMAFLPGVVLVIAGGCIALVYRILRERRR